MKILFIIPILLFTLSLHSEDKKPEMNENAEEFHKTKLIQVDSFEIPKELKAIEDQISQNVIDAIILDGSHSVVYSQKREEGYNKNFKNFYGLKVSIFPIAGKDDSFSLKLFYYNWTTNKYDKTVVNAISKYNVLNELRFSLFELFKGKVFVRENKDELERKNFERIQIVRKMIEEQKKREKKSKDRQKKKSLVEPSKVSDVESEPPAKKLKREKKELEKKDKNKQNSFEDDLKPLVNENKSPSKNNESDSAEADKEFNKNQSVQALANPKNTNRVDRKKVENGASEQALNISQLSNDLDNKINEKVTPSVKSFNFQFGFKKESANTVGLLSARTNISSFVLGANGKSEYLTKTPWGWMIKMLAGIALKKDKFQFPMARHIEADLYTRLVPRLTLYSGIEFSSLHFVNLPTAGVGLNVFENDILYAKAGGTLNGSLNKRQMGLSLEVLKSLVQKSNFNQAISVQKTTIIFNTQITDEHGLVMSYFSSRISGRILGNATGGMLAYTYSLGN